MRKIRLIAMFSICFLSESTLLAQSTFVKYLKYGQPSDFCVGWGLAEKSNGEYLVQFKYQNNASLGLDFGLFTLSSTGDSLNTIAFRNPGEDYVEHMLLINDGHVLLSGGYLPVGRSYYDLMLYRINLDDSTQNAYHHYDNFYGHFVGSGILSRFQSIYLPSYRTGTPSRSNYNLVKTNMAGVLQFDSSFVAPQSDWVLGYSWDRKSNILLTGGSFSGSTDQARVLAMRVDTNGLEQWRTFVGIEGDSTFFCRSLSGGILQAANGKVYLGGGTNNWCEEDIDERMIDKPLLICLDSNGNHLWTKKENLFPKQSHFYGEIYESSDGGLICIGDVDFPTSNDQKDNTQILVAKYDLTGNLLWKRVHGENDYNEFYYNTIQTKDGGFLITGRYENIQSPATNVRTFVMKLDACGCLVPGCDPNCIATGFGNEVANPKIELHPNPSQGILQIRTDLNIKSYSIYSMLGSLHQEGFYNEQALDLNYLPSGMYVIQFNMHDGSQQQHKFVRE
jgi:hypothetical protein